MEIADFTDFIDSLITLLLEKNKLGLKKLQKTLESQENTEEYVYQKCSRRMKTFFWAVSSVKVKRKMAKSRRKKKIPNFVRKSLHFLSVKTKMKFEITPILSGR